MVFFIYWYCMITRKTPFGILLWNFLNICDGLRDLIPYVQFQKREKHPPHPSRNSSHLHKTAAVLLLSCGKVRIVTASLEWWVEEKLLNDFTEKILKIVTYPFSKHFLEILKSEWSKLFYDLQAKVLCTFCGN